MPPLYGKYSLEAGLRNGVVPPGPHLGSMVHYANHLLAQRGKVLGRFAVGPGTGTTTTYADHYDSTASAVTWYLRFHTSPACGAVVARHILIPTDDTVGNAPNSLGFWTTTPDGGGNTAQASIYQTARIVAGATVVPDQWGAVVEQTWTDIAADTSHQAYFTVQDKFRVIGCTIWEVPRLALNTTSDTYAVDISKFHALAPIYDRDAADLLATLTRLWKRGGSSFFNWGVPGTTAARGGLTTTTPTNILDGTTGAWGADNAGFQVDPQYHGSIETVGASYEGVPVHVWAVFKTSSGAQTATVTFRDQNATIATLTHTGDTTATFVTGSTVWSAPKNATMKVDVMASCSGGATASLYACGMYQYEA